jgi:uncharacterized protein
MYSRELQAVLKRYANIYPIVGIMGPRQSGKTTLSRHVFNDRPYVSLENLDTRSYAQEDPRAFLASYAQGAIFDEIQQAPQLFSYLQEVVDNTRKTGYYILTGSQHLSLAHRVTQTLSGRIGITNLLPLSLFELSSTSKNFNTLIFHGGYPRLHQMEMQPVEFYPSYIQTYIERDVRQLKSIGNLSRFRSFLKLCAGRTGQILNLSALAQDCGISHTTAKEWLTVLEASYLIFLLPPFYNNFNKRLIKMPKLYFYDTGLACSLLGLENVRQLETHYLRGALFENLVILELLKRRLHNGLLPNLYFWRDHTGHEIDLLAEWDGQLYPIEVKMNATVYQDLSRGMRYFCKLSKVERGYLVHAGYQEGVYHNVVCVPFENIANIFEQLLAVQS